jgi:hypothetical protein
MKTTQSQGETAMTRQKRRAVQVTARDTDAELDDARILLGARPGLIREILEDLEHAREIYDTGLRRKGQIVYAATPTPKHRN